MAGRSIQYSETNLHVSCAAVDNLFYGTSQNAVKTQIWIAVSVYVLVAIVRKRLRLEASLYTLLQVLSVTVFEKMPIQAALSATHDGSVAATDDNQPSLFTYWPAAYNDIKCRNAILHIP